MDLRAQARVARVLAACAAILVAAGAAASVWWALATLGVRPLDGVEGDVLFEADRLRQGLVLYTDPARGAFDYGPVPARYLVLYPPVWSAFLSRVPAGVAPVLARLVATIAWASVLVTIVLRAPRARRFATAASAAFVFSIFTLMLYGAAGRPDAVAVALAGLSLERAARRAEQHAEAHAEARGDDRGGLRIDAVCGALFALAAWVKPNVVGLAPGALAGALIVGAARPRLRTIAPALAGAAAVSIVLASVLTALAGRAWIDHLLASTGQEPSLAQWTDQMTSRAPFFALPLGAALALGFRARRDPGAAIATFALVTSTAWCVLSFAKIGSASNYLLEPCVAAVVVVARARVPESALTPRSRLVLAALALAQTAWDDVASVRSAIERVPRAREAGAAIAEARARVGAGPGEVVLADEPGLELAMNGRIVQTPFQSTHLARRGLFPTAAWLTDVARPEVKGLVMQDDLLEKPLTEVDVAHDRFGVELRRALSAEFAFVTERGGIRIYRRVALKEKDGP